MSHICWTAADYNYPTCLHEPLNVRLHYKTRGGKIHMNFQVYLQSFEIANQIFDSLLPQAAFPCRGTELRYFLIISSGYQHTVPVVQQPGRRHPIHYIHLTAEVLFEVCTNCGFWTFRKRSPTGLCGETERLQRPKRSSEQFSSRTYLRGQHVVKGIQEKQHQRSSS